MTNFDSAIETILTRRIHGATVKGDANVVNSRDADEESGC